ITPRTEDDAQKVSRKTLIKVGWRDTRLLAAEDRKAKSTGNDVIATRFGVCDDENNEREIPLTLNNSKLGALLLRHMCFACGPEVQAKYQSGKISAADFPIGVALRVKIGIEKKSRAVPFDRNVIEDIGPVADVVVPLRSAE